MRLSRKTVRVDTCVLTAGESTLIKRAGLKSKKKKEKHRIPYDVWANSQLSIAKYFGGCKLNGKTYVLDYKNCVKKDGKYFPDLVEM